MEKREMEEGVKVIKRMVEELQKEKAKRNWGPLWMLYGVVFFLAAMACQAFVLLRVQSAKPFWIVWIIAVVVVGSASWLSEGRQRKKTRVHSYLERQISMQWNIFCVALGVTFFTIFVSAPHHYILLWSFLIILFGLTLSGVGILLGHNKQLLTLGLLCFAGAILMNIIPRFMTGIYGVLILLGLGLPGFTMHRRWLAMKKENNA